MKNLYGYNKKMFLILLRLIGAMAIISPTFVYGQATQLSSGFYLPSRDLGKYFQFVCVDTDSKGNCTSYHLGVDRNCPEGDPVYSVGEGEIQWYDPHVCGFMALNPSLRGGAMVIRHRNSEGNYFYALYGHIKKPVKTMGAAVNAGEKIAEVGPFYRDPGSKYQVEGQACSQPSTKVIKWYEKYLPHLHFGINIGTTYPRTFLGYAPTIGNWVDPLTYLNVQHAIISRGGRTAPRSIFGTKVALIGEITRADAAALLVQECLLEDLLKNIPPRRTVRMELPLDIQNNGLRTDIETVIRLGIRGLEPAPNGRFYPDEKVTRAAYALMMEDILIRVSGDDNLAMKFSGSKSPFPDLRNDLPYFNEVMVVTSRGIMQAKDLTTGEFGPRGIISGPDALLIIRKLEDELQRLVMASPSFKVKCPKCGAIFSQNEASRGLQGQDRGKCPKCGAVFNKADNLIK